MTTHEPLPVKGYTAQSNEKVALVNENKELEERVLRRIEEISRLGFVPDEKLVDHRWLAIARTHAEQAFMAMNRAVFRPERVSLPEDNIGATKAE